LNFDCATSSDTFNCTNIFSTLFAYSSYNFYGTAESELQKVTRGRVVAEIV